jgi:hypothetical protein
MFLLYPTFMNIQALTIFRQHGRSTIWLKSVYSGIGPRITLPNRYTFHCDVRYLDCGMVGPPPGGVWRGAEEGEGGRVQEQAGQVGGRGNPVEQVHQVPVQDRVQVGAGRLCSHGHIPWKLGTGTCSSWPQESMPMRLANNQCFWIWIRTDLTLLDPSVVEP